MDISNTRLAPTRALIDLGKLRSNLRLLKERSNDLGVFAVVKSNAYGHGAIEVSSTLTKEGVDGLAVATVAEAIELRESGAGSRILVFGAPRRASVSQYPEYDLELFVTSLDSLELLKGLPGIRVHLHIDTGMGRLGVQPSEVNQALSKIDALSGAELVGLSTHFAAAGDPGGDFSKRQWRVFNNVLENLKSSPAPIHVASTGAFFTIPESIDPDRIKYTRPGIGLYGLLDLPKAPMSDTLQPVMTLVSEVAHVKRVPKGASISYDGRWHAPRETFIATISAGYADGYPRNLTNKGFVSINGNSYRVVGTVCMDLIMLDLGPDPSVRELVGVGDPVILFGEGGPQAVQLARLADTITYELVCRVGTRVERVYLDGEESS